MRAYEVAARDDAIREVAAAVQAAPLGREPAIAVAAERHLDAVDDHADDVADAHVAGVRGAEPGHPWMLLDPLHLGRSSLGRGALGGQPVRLHLLVDAR